MRFEFATAGRILFGPGTLAEVAPLAAGLGRRAFVVTGGSADRAGTLLDALIAEGLELTRFEVRGEPTTSLALEAVRLACGAACDIVIGFGGGSVLDTGKVVAAMLASGGELSDYLEVIGKAQPVGGPCVPYIAVPTTAGTGAEVTRNAVLLATDYEVKVSMRGHGMLPRVAVVDPDLTLSMPPAVTAGTGMDALTQLLEAFVSLRANPLSDGICREGLQRAARSLRRAYDCGLDRSAREDMALASLFGGLALANAGLGAVHGFAGVIGGMFDAPHGAVCACLLPFVMATSVHALTERDPDSFVLAKFSEAACILTGNSSATVEDGVGWVCELCEHLEIPSLSRYGIGKDRVARLVRMARNAGSMKSNPILLTDAELTAILDRALE